jgi:hypothetical protein
MAKGMPHFFKDGTPYTGGTHKMPDGSLHSGSKHTSSSKPVFHLKDLSKSAKEKAMNYGKKPKKPMMKKKPAPKKKAKK